MVVSKTIETFIFPLHSEDEKNLEKNFNLLKYCKNCNLCIEQVHIIRISLKDFISFFLRKHLGNDDGN